MKNLLYNLAPYRKSSIVMLHDAVLAFIFIFLSLYIRLNDFSPEIYFSTKFLLLFFMMGISQVISFHIFGLYKGIWRFSSTFDLIRVLKGVSFAVLSSFAVAFFFNRLEGIPRGAFIIDWLFLIVGLGGGRLTYRILSERIRVKEIERNHNDRVIIVGAGFAGEQLIRDIRRTPSLKMHVVAFVDDDIEKRGKLLHGTCVKGSIFDIEQVVRRSSATKVIIAIPTATGEEIKRIVKCCGHTGVEFKTLPHIKDVLYGKISFSALRDVEPEDLLGREETVLDKKSISVMLTQNRVMVTGAGGSIGSELCSQIASYNPEELILFEISELNLYHLEKVLQQKFPNLKYTMLIGDVRDKFKVERAISSYAPKVIFHAAAYKHVPMMEINPEESIHTNVFGTKILAEAATKFGVERFVMVSTDKAVRPTNIMGASKRIAEMVCQNIQEKSVSTKFMTVRFGNVLGSSGSVIPLFKKQILAGGPITVTHPEITRFFMSIPEACQLVMQAGALGLGNEIFILNMGESVKIVDLAKQMITLSGLTEKEIEITFTGLRPGEKLYEELLMEEEGLLPTISPLLKVARSRKSPPDFEEELKLLASVISNNNSSNFVKRVVATIVSDYKPFLNDEEGENIHSEVEDVLQ